MAPFTKRILVPITFATTPPLVLLWALLVNLQRVIMMVDGIAMDLSHAFFVARWPIYILPALGFYDVTHVPSWATHIILVTLWPIECNGR